MKVEIVDVFGSDEKVQRMARISYGVTKEVTTDDYLKPFILKLIANGHLVPFEHCAITYFLECPVYVARQIARYRTAVISERSMRYCGALKSEDDDKSVDDFYKSAFSLYAELIKEGVPMERARGVLPLSTPTQLYYTMNLRNLMHFFDQRIDPHAQHETENLADLMAILAAKRFPLTMEAYWENRKK